MDSVLDIEIPKFVEWYYRCVDDKGHMSNKSHKEMCKIAGEKIHLWQKFLRQKDFERFVRKEAEHEHPIPIMYLPERFELGNEKETSCTCKADQIREDEDKEEITTEKRNCIIQ